MTNTDRRTLLGVGALLIAWPTFGAAAAPAPAVVYKTPTCGCCRRWVEDMNQAGFPLRVVDLDDLAPIKRRLGVPAALTGCHTAVIGGYVIEGHVPPQDVARLLKARPVALGLSVPGMPQSAPGMETPGARREPYDTLLMAKNGPPTVFMHHL